MTTSQKIAVVTGAGSGIGKAVALALAGEGYAVVLAGRRRDALEQTVREQTAPDGARHAAVPTDVTDPASVRALFDRTKDAFGRLDLLFNNAGVGAPGVPLDELTVEQWRAVVDTNLTGPFLCTQQAFRLMKSQTPKGGRIINNGSISAYCAETALGAVHGNQARDHRADTIHLARRPPHDIACGQIDIGNAATELAAKMAKGVPQANGEIAVEPLMDVGHVARAVVYMAGLPLEANVQFMTVMATKMPFIGRG